MGAAIRHIVLGEANTCQNFIGDQYEGENLNWDLNLGLEVLVKLMICLVLISSHIVGSNVKIVRFFPPINFLFTL